ncbi:hypothetical protein FGRMN_4340 [Fusarium graminum]|nr:hypothetical protein FGRMN_4340 [Fusarium graminum]
MSRQSVAARNLSLTEELERLEQSITLTLQEIDHNFSKSHRIVTTSILPLVEQYGDHSRAVWEASKFWKQFFEASANVSLSGYEELANDDESENVEESTAMREDITTDYTSQHNEDVTTATGVEQSTFQAEDSLLDDAELTGSTPRPGKTKARFSDLESPYEVMKREMQSEEDDGNHTTVLDDNEDSTVLFAQHTARLPDMSMTPQNQRDYTMTGEQSVQSHKDPLLHRMLDKNYRIQATPHKPALRVSPLKSAQPKSAKKTEPAWNDSPGSSPEMAIPTLRSEAFMSPYKSNARQRLAAATQGPRTPGVSVQTPATARKTRDVFAEGSTKASGKDKYEISWDSDEGDEDIDLYAGMSPPKTIQFALPPSKLLQTPAREASQRIVGDILLDAGADPNSSEYSPSMVKMNEDILNDSF